METKCNFQSSGYVSMKPSLSAKKNWTSKTIRLFTVIITLLFFSLTGCKKDMMFNREATNQLKPDKDLVKPSTQLPPEFKEKLLRLKGLINSNSKLKKSYSGFISKTDPQYRNMVLNALNATEPVCNDNTLLDQWLDNKLEDWNQDVISFVLATDMLNLPFYYSYFFENSSANQFYGVNGEYTKIITKTFKDLKRFWNIQTNDMVIVAMHGGMMQDRNKLVKTYNIIYGLDMEDAEFYADLVLQLLQYFPQYENGNHPIFTFNAVSIAPSNFEAPIGMIPPKIVMGDGIMEGFTAIGYGDVAPQVILAHEFGHQIQFQLNIFTDENTPEATRRNELMADAYAAYYLSHARGATMQWKRVKQFLQVFFNLGDCGFDSPGHHGTPEQRMASAEWGYSVANNAQKQGHILTAQEFTNLFEAQLPAIIAK